jgi:hypothetical protein
MPFKNTEASKPVEGCPDFGKKIRRRTTLRDLAGQFLLALV